MENSFGSWVKRRRKSLDLTQQELAKRVGCSVSAIFKIESNERRPSRQVAELLAAVLEIPEDQRTPFLKLARLDYSVSAQAGPPRETPSVDSAPPLPAPDLPVPLNPLVGREHELSVISDKIQEPGCRLLTLTGPGGVGKTRLAIEAAHRLRDAFAPGPYFIPLVGTSAAEFIIPSIGDALGFPFSGSSGLKEQLFHYLKEKRLLLVLDNLEHLLDGIEMLDELLAFAPGVKILTTSREPLNLSAEWVFEVHGLPVPSTTRVDDLTANSAAALFLQRARQININFAPTQADLLAIARICQLVEGLPLGLELAASWVRVTSLEEVAREIEQSLDFLRTSARDVPQRHRSMRAVFDQSWNQLSDEEQQALQRLSVFRAGFTREAAQAVAGANLPLLSALVDTSFVRRNGPRRYDMHELTRQYAASRVAAEAGTARARHAAFFLTLLAERENALRSSQQKACLDELKPEIENIRAAWDDAIRTEAIDLLCSAAGGYYYFYELQQFFQEAEAGFRRAAGMIQKGLEALRAAARQGEPSPAEDNRLLGALAEMEGRQAFFLQRSGRNAEALEMYQRSLERARGLNEPFLIAYTLVFNGVVSWAVGRYEQAAASFAEGLPLARQYEHPWLCIIGLCFMGALEHDLGQYEAAYAHFQESMTLCRETGDPYITLLIGTLFSRTAQARGLLDQAQDLLQESVGIARETGNRWAIGLGLEQLAAIALETGDPSYARRMLEESGALHRDVGDSWSLSRALHALSQTALAQGDLSAAGQAALEGFRVAAREDYFPNALDCLADLAAVQARLDRPAQALEIALNVLRHSASPQQARTLAEVLRLEIAERMSEEDAAAVVKRVEEQTAEEYVHSLVKGTQHIGNG